MPSESVAPSTHEGDLLKLELSPFWDSAAEALVSSAFASAANRASVSASAASAVATSSFAGGAVGAIVGAGAGVVAVEWFASLATGWTFFFKAQCAREVSPKAIAAKIARKAITATMKGSPVPFPMFSCWGGGMGRDPPGV